MTTTIFDKTGKGRDEIATRANHLAPRLRTLLLLVDGKRDTVELMAKVAGLGLDEKSLVDLLEGGYVQVAGAAVRSEVAPLAQPSGTVPVATTLSSAVVSEPDASISVQPSLDAAVSNPSTTPAVPLDSAPQAATAPVAPGTTSRSDINAAHQGILRDGETQYQALYNFFNETIRSVIGLRGFAMQLKVERASTIADFRLLRPAYLEAVLKAKGPEMERSLRDRLDQLLGLGD